MKSIFASIALTLSLFASVASAQVVTGTPAFGSFGGGPFDTVNLGNLNVHFAIPVLHKAGRGIPFTYDLTYDSSIWTPVTSGGTTQWQPAIDWGWNIATAASSGYVTEDVTNSTIISHPCNIGETTYSNYVYHDPFGKQHVFVTSTSSPTPVTSWVRVNPCGHTTTYSGYVSGVAADGSGYAISAQYTSATVTARDGTLILDPMNSYTGSATATDANGNEVTANSSNQYFDTLSSSTPVLTVGGSGTTSSPNTFTYTAPSGASASYTMNYTQYTVSTNFGVSSISEYGPTSVPLVSSIVLPDSTSYSFTYEATSGSCTPLGGTSSCVTGRLASVTLPTGGTVNYSYSGGSASTGIYSDGSTGDLTRILSPSTSCGSGCWQYVRALLGSTAPGPGSAWTTTVTDPASNQTVLNFTEDSRTTSSSSVATYNMYETERQTYQGSSTLLATRVVCYNASYSSCGTSSSVNSPISQTDTYTELPSTSTRLSETVYNGSYTASGLVSDDREYDYGVSMTSAPGTTHLVEETVTSYASLGNGIVDHPSSVVVSDWTGGSAVTIASTSYTYDGTSVTATSGTPQHTSISGSRGNLTTLATQVNGSTTLYRTNSYYDTGNVYVSTDLSTSSGSPGPSTTYSYGSGSCGNSFPTSISEPLSLGRSTTWNCTGGVASQATDETTQSVSAGYSSDPYFWRPSSVTDQASNTISLTYTGQTSTESTLTFNSGNSVSDVLATLDGFGRPILSQVKQSPSATNYDSSQTAYNSLGQPYESTMPFSAAAGTTSGTAPYTTTTYDALGRVTNVQDANGGYVSYTYTNNDVVQTTSSTGSGAQSFSKQLEYDGLGRLSSVCEMSTTLSGVGTCSQSTSQTGYWTKYTYDALGHLLTVTQNAQASSSNQQTRSYAFDMIGRMTSESNPETSNSGANGTAYYTYDVASGSCSASAGNMTKRVDNAGNTTCYSYDSIHRVTDAGSSGTCRHFRYDTSATPPSGVSVSNTTAQMEEAYTNNCSTTLLTDEWFSYSVRGELTDVYEATPNSGGYYHTTAAYWPSGALETLSGIPSVPTISYGAAGTGLDGEGRYTAVSASGTNPVTGVTYSTTSTSNPLGSITGVTYGSGDSDSFTYDLNTGREGSYTFSVNGSTDAGSLGWNANGTLASLAIVDGISGTSDTQTCGFTYDDLGRVGGQDVNGYSADCGTAWQQLFTYDAFGNVQKSGSLNFAASYAPASNQFTLSGATVTYDGNGNLTNDNLNSYTWDPNWGTMQSVNSVTATYDALGRVVEQGNGSAYAQILYSPVGKTAIMSGSSLTEAFVGLPGGGTAVYNSSGLSYFRHADWLGSSRLASTTSRTLYSSTAYAPFGEQYATSGTADASFTGQNSDAVSSLYDFMARRQSPSQGRWISPDPSGVAAVDPMSPQTWNRYGYVSNNPLRMIDPLGLTEADGGAGGDGEGDDSCDVDACVNANPCPVDSCVTTNLDPPVPVIDVYSDLPVLGGYTFIGMGARTPVVGPNKPAPSNTGCFVKGLVSGAVGAAVVGGVAAGAVALGVVSAPVATAVLTGAAVIGGGALLINSAYDYATGNTAGLAYNAGSVLGGAVVGGLGARITYGQLSPGQTFKGLSLSSLKAEFGQMFNPKMGPPNLNYWGTGPTSWFAAGGPATAGAGASTAKKGGC